MEMSEMWANLYKRIWFWFELFFNKCADTLKKCEKIIKLYNLKNS